MNVRNLRDNHPKLITYMEESGYCICHTRKVKREIERILSGADTKCWESYADIYLEYAKKSDSPHYLRYKRTLLNTIERFDVRGQYPDGKRHRMVVERDNYHLLSQDFKAVIDYYKSAEKLRGKKEATIYCESHSAASFLVAMLQRGIDSVEKITEEDALAAFITEDGALRRSCTYKRNVAAVFKACVPEAPEVFNRILAFLPELKETRKNIQYLKPAEIVLIKQVLVSEESILSLRDRAVGMLAMYTGLRCCDIAGLRTSDVDWENERIHICQQKTGVPLELPLAVIVGNAIYDYLVSERIATDSEYMFLSKNRPYGRLTSVGVNNIAKKIMKAANVRQASGDRRGFHIFRHHLATELLGNGVPQPVISKVLGHTSPSSVERYLSADFKHLKECALSTERFPMPEGVLGNA
jgi:integrase